MRDALGDMIEHHSFGTSKSKDTPSVLQSSNNSRRPACVVPHASGEHEEQIFDPCLLILGIITIQRTEHDAFGRPAQDFT
jgi:hypothetical protein